MAWGRMLRRSLLFLSEREGLKRTFLKTRLARGLAERFVAGEDLGSALATAARLDEAGFRVTLDYLGESTSRPEEAHRATEAYLDSLERIAESGTRCTISLKLTQLGLDIDAELCLANLRRVVSAATDLGSFTRIDMEGSEHTEATLDAYRRVAAAHRSVGVVIQSYMHRSEADITRLMEERASVRLCKGAYKEPASVAYQRRDDVDASFKRLARRLLEYAGDGEVVGGVPPVAIATHDDEMIEHARSFADSHAVPVDAFEFQMLYGVRRDVQTQLARAGYGVRVYVPYGTEWYSYFMRRMAERPANLLFVARAAAGK